MGCSRKGENNLSVFCKRDYIIQSIVRYIMYISYYGKIFIVVKIVNSMKYFTKREKIDQLIIEQIIPCVNNSDLDYEKTLHEIMNKMNCSRNAAEDSLRSHIPNHIKEVHILTIPESKVEDWLESIKKRKEQINNEIKEVGL